MNQFLLPTDAEFVEIVAKAIAKERLFKDASAELNNMIGVEIDINNHTSLEQTFDRVFEMLWTGTTDVDERQKSAYRNDARAAISAINLKLLTS